MTGQPEPDQVGSRNGRSNPVQDGRYLVKEVAELIDANGKLNRGQTLYFSPRNVRFRDAK
jgi:hypothetical protein